MTEDKAKTTDEAEPESPPLERLREPFPQGAVGKLPKGGIELDYVGHAAVTDRLLSIDPEWNWEPMGVDAYGLPVLDEQGNLWIRLTICGVTRLGVGDGKSMKERIGDALRNAAMRFGVALSLWTKDELESGYAEDKATDNVTSTTTRRAAPRPSSDRHADADAAEGVSRGAASISTEASTPQMNKIRAMLANDVTPSVTGDDVHEYVAGILAVRFPEFAVEGSLTSLKQLSKSQASYVIDQLGTQSGAS